MQWQIAIVFFFFPPLLIDSGVGWSGFASSCGLAALGSRLCVRFRSAHVCLLSDQRPPGDIVFMANE